MVRFDLIAIAKQQLEQHTMRDITILHDLLLNQCPGVHKKRLCSLMVAVQALLDGQQLSLTELGRNVSGEVAAKHNIKRIDRLLCGANPMPIILLDWSDVREQMRHQTLRASVCFEGRSVVLYERVFAFEHDNSPVSLNPFLRELASILPLTCCSLIVTDAGYRNPWFRKVNNLGWFFLGRVRGEVEFCASGSENWVSNKARYLGLGKLGRKSPIHTHLYLYKANPKQRKDSRSSKARRHHTAQASYRAGSKEPWLLTTNLPTNTYSAKQLVNIYAKRMQIEESFRDVKSRNTD